MVDFGLALVERHIPAQPTGWMDDLERILPHVQGKMRSLWMTDHLFWGEQYAYECWTVLSTLAARWPQFEVGPMVMCQSYRNPALLAKMGATLQLFSGGRFIMGLGAGWKEDEYRGYGYDFPGPRERLEQLEESLVIVKRLWTEIGPISYGGRHYRLEEALLEPKPNPVPPICVGVKGDKALRLAARYGDWWNVSDTPLAVYRERCARLDEWCEAERRDPRSLRRTWFGRLVTGVNEAQVQALAKSRDTVYTTENAFVGTPGQVVEQLEAFVAAGCETFMLDIVGLPDEDILDRVVRDILPRFGKA